MGLMRPLLFFLLRNQVENHRLYLFDSFNHPRMNFRNYESKLNFVWNCEILIGFSGLILFMFASYRGRDKRKFCFPSLRMLLLLLSIEIIILLIVQKPLSKDNKDPLQLWVFDDIKGLRLILGNCILNLKNLIAKPRNKLYHSALDFSYLINKSFKDFNVKLFRNHSRVYKTFFKQVISYFLSLLFKIFSLIQLFKKLL